MPPHISTQNLTANLIFELEEAGMPVNMLRVVLPHVRRFLVAGRGEKGFWSPSTKELALNYSAAQLLPFIEADGFNLYPEGGLSELYDIGLIYHEFTHAYLDLQVESGDASAQWIETFGTTYYMDAPMDDDTTIKDRPRASRLLTEAAAAYVGGKAMAMWVALEGVARLERMRQDRDVPPGGLPSHISAASGISDPYGKDIDHVKGAYNASIDDIGRDYGSSSRSPGYSWGVKPRNALGELATHLGLDRQTLESLGLIEAYYDEQVGTSRPISGQLKSYCDFRILEGKIPDTFGMSPLLGQLVADL